MRCNRAEGSLSQEKLFELGPYRRARGCGGAGAAPGAGRSVCPAADGGRRWRLPAQPPPRRHRDGRTGPAAAASQLPRPLPDPHSLKDDPPQPG